MKKATELKNLLRVFKPLPLEGETFESFHVDTNKARGDNYAFRLSAYLDANIDDPQKILFMGHRGSGKSTELWQVKKNLGTDYWIVTFSIKDEIDVTDLNYIDLVFTILNKLTSEAIKDGIEIDESVVDNLFNYWNNESFIEIIKTEKAQAEASLEAKISFLTKISASVKGILSTGKETKQVVRKYIEPKLSQLITGINDLIFVIADALRKQGKVPILIIEDLDKLDIPVAEDLFLNHRNILTDLNIHIIYTFPIFLHYSDKYNEIKDSFNHSELLSMIKVKNKDGSKNEDGIETIRQIVEKRAEVSLFDPQALTFIIEKSGGTLRNVFEMIHRAALTVLGRGAGSTIIDMDDAKKAYRELKSDFERCIAHKHLETLKELHRDQTKKPLSDANLMELLNCMAVIEYNGERWCDLHPAVEDILKDKGIIGALAKR